MKRAVVLLVFTMIGFGGMSDVLETNKRHYKTCL